MFKNGWWEEKKQTILEPKQNETPPQPPAIVKMKGYLG